MSSGEKHRNCSKGTKWAHRHTSAPGKLFKRGLGCWLLWLFTFNLTVFHQSTSRNTKGALKWRFLFIIFVPWMWAAGKQNSHPTYPNNFILFISLFFYPVLYIFNQILFESRGGVGNYHIWRLTNANRVLRRTREADAHMFWPSPIIKRLFFNWLA